MPWNMFITAKEVWVTFFSLNSIELISSFAIFIKFMMFCRFFLSTVLWRLQAESGKYWKRNRLSREFLANNWIRCSSPKCIFQLAQHLCADGVWKQFNWIVIWTLELCTDHILTISFRGNLKIRIVWSIVIEAVLFIGTVALAMIDTFSTPALFYYLTIASVVLINSTWELNWCNH